MSANYYSNKGGAVTLSPRRAVAYFDRLSEQAEYVNGEKHRTFIVRKVPTLVCGETVNAVTHESFFDYITAKNLAQ